MKLWVRLLPVFLLLSIIFFPSKIEARSGCCSHHGGVCGCGCCDGTGLSSTCAPYYPECNGSQPVEELPTQYIKPTVFIPTGIPPTRRPTVIPTKKPTPTLKVTLTPTSVPTLVLSPTEVLLPTSTQATVSNPLDITETKVFNNQSWFTRLFSWLFGKK